MIIHMIMTIFLLFAYKNSNFLQYTLFITNMLTHCKSTLFPESFLFLSTEVGLGNFSIDSSKNITFKMNQRFWGSKSDAVVSVLASYQCDRGSNPGLNAICGLSLLLVLSVALRGFTSGTLVFPSPPNPTLPNSNSIWNARTHLNEFIRTHKCFVRNK